MVNIPPGFQTMFPYMFCDDPNGFSDFLINAFDAQEMNRTMRGDIVANMQMQIGTMNFMISQADENYPAMAAAYYLYVESADSTMVKAIAAGATLEMEAMDMSYGDRQGGVVDPFGNIWWVSQRLTDQPYDN
jgi:PhnB protein